MAETVGVVYGNALSDLSFEEGCEEQVYRQMQQLKDLFEQNEKLYELLSAPVLSLAEKLNLLDSVFGEQVLPMVLNFLKVMTENGRADALGEAADEVKRLYYEKRNIKEVTVTSAAPLSEQQQNKLKAVLQQKLGAEIVLQLKTDKALIGGLCVEYDGQRLDATVENRLRQIEHTIKEGV